MKVRRYLVAAPLLGALASPAQGGWSAAGFQAGLGILESKDEFSQYDVLVLRDLPWSRRWASGRTLRTQLNLRAGVIDADGETGGLVAVGPSVAFTRPASRFGFDAGINLAWLSRDRFGARDFGQALQFISSIGVKYRLGGALSIGYRLQHMSNAGLDRTNPGLDMATIEVVWRLP